MKSFHYIIRFNDCDPFGHLNNSKYIDYFLNAREDHLREGPGLLLDKFHEQGIGWVVSNHEIYYLRPADYNEKVSIESDLIQAGENALLVEMRMFDEKGEVLKSIMWTKFTCINMKTGRKQSHPDDFMELARQLVVQDINVDAGIKQRIASLQGRLV